MIQITATEGQIVVIEGHPFGIAEARYKRVVLLAPTDPDERDHARLIEALRGYQTRIDKREKRRKNSD